MIKLVLTLMFSKGTILFIDMSKICETFSIGTSSVKTFVEFGHETSYKKSSSHAEFKT